nr:uncharacterized protein LOC111767624 [Equus caballus]
MAETPATSQPGGGTAGMKGREKGLAVAPKATQGAMATAGPRSSGEWRCVNTAAGRPPRAGLVNQLPGRVRPDPLTWKSSRASGSPESLWDPHRGSPRGARWAELQAAAETVCEPAQPASLEAAGAPCPSGEIITVPSPGQMSAGRSVLPRAAQPSWPPAPTPPHRPPAGSCAWPVAPGP